MRSWPREFSSLTIAATRSSMILKTDPDALHNLIHDPDQQERIKIYKERLKNYMKESNDPVYPQFAEYLEKQQS